MRNTCTFFSVETLHSGVVVRLTVIYRPECFVRAIHQPLLLSTAINQSINRSINQSINQSINRSIYQSINQPTNQSINQINLSINQSIYQMNTFNQINQSINLKIGQTDRCPCNTGPMTSQHLLQECPQHDIIRQQTWPDETPLRDKLYGDFQALQRTASFICRNYTVA